MSAAYWSGKGILSYSSTFTRLITPPPGPAGIKESRELTECGTSGMPSSLERCHSFSRFADREMRWAGDGRVEPARKPYRRRHQRARTPSFQVIFFPSP